MSKNDFHIFVPSDLETSNLFPQLGLLLSSAICFY